MTFYSSLYVLKFKCKPLVQFNLSHSITFLDYCAIICRRKMIVIEIMSQDWKFLYIYGINFCNIKTNLDTRLWNNNSRRMSLIADIVREQGFVNPSRASSQNAWECIYQLPPADFVFRISENEIHIWRYYLTTS